MIGVDTYLAAVAQRIEQAGGRVQRARIGPVDAVLGDVFEASVIARGHIRFTAVVAPLSAVTAFAVATSSPTSISGRCGPRTRCPAEFAARRPPPP